MVTLGANTTLTGTDPTFTAGVTGIGKNLTLSFSGTTAIDGAKFTGINQLIANNGGLTQLTGALTTTGSQTYTDNVVLMNDVTLTGTAVAFGGTLNDNGATSDESLVIVGNLSLNGVVGEIGRAHV